MSNWWMQSGMSHARCVVRDGEKRCKNRGQFPSGYCKRHEHLKPVPVVQPERRDMIAELFALLESAGAVMTLDGKPITESELRPEMEKRALKRMKLDDAGRGEDG